MTAYKKWIEMFGKPPETEDEKLTVKVANLFDKRKKKQENGGNGMNDRIGLMPCGSTHSCLNCIHAVLITDPCSYLSRMTEGEVDYHMDKLREIEKESLDKSSNERGEETE